MFGTKKLTKSADGTAPADVSMSDAQERQRATLLRNELIAGDEEIVTRIMNAARSDTFEKGIKIIEQGAFDDCAYFIVSGSVGVRINDRHIDIRSAPHTVGEMAAKKAGEPRTADVIVHSQTLEVLVLSGTEFRKLMQDFPAFSRNLDDLMDSLSRRKITQLGDDKKAGGFSWTVISAITGLGSAIVAALVAGLAMVGPFEVGIASGVTGVVTFVCMLIANPVLRYRNLASAAGYALIMLIAYGSFSFMLTIDGKEIQLPLIDFSVQTEMKLGALIVSCIALLVLTWLSS